MVYSIEGFPDVQINPYHNFTRVKCFGDGGFAGAPSYGSSGPHLALSRPGLWLYWLLLPLPSRFLRPSRAPASLPSHGTRTYEDSFIVYGADEAGPHRLVQRILDGWEVACSCHLSDPSCQFRRRLSRLPLDGAPELVSFPHSELCRVV